MNKINYAIFLVAILIITVLVLGSIKKQNFGQEIDVKKLMYYGDKGYIGEKVPTIPFENESDFFEYRDKKYYCVSDGKESKRIQYPSPYKEYSGSNEGNIPLGYGGERGAIICGKFYFVYDFSSSFGDRYYGPFPL